MTHNQREAISRAVSSLESAEKALQAYLSIVNATAAEFEVDEREADVRAVIKATHLHQAFSYTVRDAENMVRLAGESLRRFSEMGETH